MDSLIAQHQSTAQETLGFFTEESDALAAKLDKEALARDVTYYLFTLLGRGGAADEAPEDLRERGQVPNHQVQECKCHC